MPGAEKIECGNYLEHDLKGAKEECEKYLRLIFYGILYSKQQCRRTVSFRIKFCFNICPTTVAVKSSLILGDRKLNPWVTAMSAQASDMSGWLLTGVPGLAYAGIVQLCTFCP